MYCRHFDYGLVILFSVIAHYFCIVESFICCIKNLIYRTLYQAGMYETALKRRFFRGGQALARV